MPYEQTMAEHHHPPAEKLRFLSSPLVRRDADGDVPTYESHRKHHACKHHRDGLDDELPRLETVGSPRPSLTLRVADGRLHQHEGPTLLEIFFDLFFAANYNAFSETQKVTNHARFKAYVGYFWYASLLVSSATTDLSW